MLNLIQQVARRGIAGSIGSISVRIAEYARDGMIAGKESKERQDSEQGE